MTSLSYSVNRDQSEQPDAITVGTSAPGAGDVEVRIDLTTHTPTRQNVILALQAIIRRIETQYSEFSQI